MNLKKYIVITILFMLASSVVFAAPKADLWPYWKTHNSSNTVRIDHSFWDGFLKEYLDSNHPSGINRMRYKSVHPDDRRGLENYITNLEKAKVTGLNEREQKAYWINLYNALTVHLILENYPVKSIRDINKPWSTKLLTIEGNPLSLNDIEHRILRPIFQDNRIHYAVNCASIGCPNLQSRAFTVDNTEQLLDRAAREYITHPRGVSIEKNRMTLSSIYTWFRDDFGESQSEVLDHLRSYVSPELKSQIENFKGKIKYSYDWGLNE